MERAVEDDEVELPGRKRQPVEARLDGREARNIVAGRAQPVRFVSDPVDRAHVMALTGEAVRQPSVPGAEIEDAQSTTRTPQERQQMLVALSANAPFRGVRIVRRDLGQAAVVLSGRCPVTLALADRPILPREWLRVCRLRRAEEAPDALAQFVRVPARAAISTPVGAVEIIAACWAREPRYPHHIFFRAIKK